MYDCNILHLFFYNFLYIIGLVVSVCSELLNEASYKPQHWPIDLSYHGSV